MNTSRLLILGALAVGWLPLHSSAQTIDLIAYWDFNNKSDPTKSVDVAKGITGAMNGATYGAGRTGSATDFGLDVEAESSAVLLVEDGSFLNIPAEKDTLSVVFWQKNTSDVRNQSGFWFNSPSSNNGERGFQAHTPWSDNNIYFDSAGCCGADTRVQTSTPDGVDLNTWTHFAFVKNKGIKQIWVNGELAIESEDVSAPLPTDFTTLYIGNAGGATQSPPSILDDFAIFGNALTGAQVKTLAGGAAPSDLTDASDPGNDLAAAIDFGNRPSLSTAQELTIAIRNPGKTKELLISSMKIAGADAANFTLVSFPATIAPQQTAVVKINFDPKGAFKKFAANLETATNDPDAADKNIVTALTATVIGADSDKDTLTDEEEVKTYKTDPFLADTDKEGLDDAAEVKTHKTDPLKADTDGDGFSDALEVEKKSNPLDPKSDPLANNKFNLLAYWDFNTVGVEDTKDLIGGVAAKLEGAEFSADKGGKTGVAGDRAMSFVGGRALVEDASFANSAGALNRLTVTFWQKLDEVSNSCAFWFNGDGVGGDRAAQAHTPWSDGNIYFDTAGCCGAGTQRISGPAPEEVSDTSKWSHFAFVKNGDQKEVWVNGVLAVEGTNTGKLVQNFTTLSLGSDGAAGGILQGSLDDFAVFGAVLTEADIKKLVGGTKPNELSGVNTGGQVVATFTIGEVKVVAGKLRLAFGSETGKTYDVEASDDLIAWTKLATVNGAGASTSHDIDPGIKFKRFYRVKRN